jgi:hypothetical protein
MQPYARKLNLLGDSLFQVGGMSQNNFPNSLIKRARVSLDREGEIRTVAFWPHSEDFRQPKGNISPAEILSITGLESEKSRPIPGETSIKPEEKQPIRHICKNGSEHLSLVPQHRAGTPDASSAAAETPGTDASPLTC